jgi:hypothetical protein
LFTWEEVSESKKSLITLTTINPISHDYLQWWLIPWFPATSWIWHLNQQSLLSLRVCGSVLWSASHLCTYHVLKIMTELAYSSSPLLFIFPIFNCYGLDVCPSKINTLKLNPQRDGIEGWGLGRWLTCEDSAFMDEISVLRKGL